MNFLSLKHEVLLNDVDAWAECQLLRNKTSCIPRNSLLYHKFFLIVVIEKILSDLLSTFSPLNEPNLKDRARAGICYTFEPNYQIRHMLSSTFEDET